MVSWTRVKRKERKRGKKEEEEYKYHPMISKNLAASKEYLLVQNHPPHPCAWVVAQVTLGDLYRIPQFESMLLRIYRCSKCIEYELVQEYQLKTQRAYHQPCPWFCEEEKSQKE